MDRSRLTHTHDLDYRVSSLRVSDGATDIVSLDYAYGDGINLTAVNANVTSANNLGLGYSPANRLSSDWGQWGSSCWQQYVGRAFAVV